MSLMLVSRMVSGGQHDTSGPWRGQGVREYDPPAAVRSSTGGREMSRLWIAGAALTFAIVVSSMGAEAQGLITMQKLSAPLANELVGETVAACAQKGYTVTAVVVDLDGVRQALLRGNGAPIHTLDNAFYKA